MLEEAALVEKTDIRNIAIIAHVGEWYQPHCSASVTQSCPRLVEQVACTRLLCQTFAVDGALLERVAAVLPSGYPCL